MYCLLELPKMRQGDPLMIEVKLPPPGQKVMVETTATVLNAICGAFAGEDLRFTVIQVDDTTLRVQATDEDGEEVF
jgi:hypothetical protein